MGISFNGIIGVLVLWISMAMASGNGAWVWKSLAYVRVYTLKESKKDWGYPSIWKRNHVSYGVATQEKFRLIWPNRIDNL